MKFFQDFVFIFVATLIVVAMAVICLILFLNSSGPSVAGNGLSFNFGFYDLIRIAALPALLVALPVALVGAVLRLKPVETDKKVRGTR